jgi:hypothetical protein
MIKEKQMKKYLVSLLLCALGALPVSATSSKVYNAKLVNEQGLAYNNTYPLPTANNGQSIDYFSAQVTVASATYPVETFSSGSQSTFTVTVASSPALGNPAWNVCIAGKCFIGGEDFVWDPLGVSSNTAKNFSAAVNTYFAGILTSTSGISSSVVSATSTQVGYDPTLTSSSQTALTIGPYTSSSTVTGAASGTAAYGTAPGYSSGSAIITLATNPYWANDPSQKSSLAMSVIYSTSSATAITGLTWGSTYYVIPLNATQIELASTSTGAIAGVPIVLKSSSTQLGNATITYTLTPSGLVGTPSYVWQVSNDCLYYPAPYTSATWNNFTTTVSSISIASTTIAGYTNGGATSITDFYQLDYDCIRLNVVAPTSGAIQLKVIGEGKSGFQN